MMPQTTNTHLAATSSYHCPLLIEMVSKEAEHIEDFRFLNAWVDSPLF